MKVVYDGKIRNPKDLKYRDRTIPASGSELNKNRENQFPLLKMNILLDSGAKGQNQQRRYYRKIMEVIKKVRALHLRSNFFKFGVPIFTEFSNKGSLYEFVDRNL